MSGVAQPARAKVLVVEDEPAIADVVARYLRRAGYDIAIAGTGRDALGRP
jgi:CheY-like chemotaxis protein